MSDISVIINTCDGKESDVEVIESLLAKHGVAGQISNHGAPKVFPFVSFPNGQTISDLHSIEIELVRARLQNPEHSLSWKNTLDLMKRNCTLENGVKTAHGLGYQYIVWNGFVHLMGLDSKSRPYVNLGEPVCDLNRVQ